ncbi:SpoIIE family protein phosphatase [Vicingus serpentipes]|uniref:SpoIIE family protein phosphatase n=1 Tax=Vicingus serpentipes TaxID=1926625 RepID=A0A5C6RR23_9FLAO|nr:SpoIIE family protein phosphatase [Vicingus serpentipes]TXB64801.1 SpoIIE family protein phosphatase [Vicingus serpentipes]
MKGAIKYLVISLSVLSISLLIYLIIDLNATIDELVVSTLEQESEQVKSECEDLLENVTNEFIIYEENLSASKIDLNKNDFFYNTFIPLLKHSNIVSSLLLANANGDELMLLKIDSVNYISRVSFDQESTEIDIKYKDGEISFLDSSATKEKYDAKIRPWFINAYQNPNKLNLTKPYLFFRSKKMGGTISKTFISSTDTMVLAFDILLSDISKVTKSLDLSENGFSLVVNEENKIIGLPKLHFAHDSSNNLLKSFSEVNHPLLNMISKEIDLSEGDQIFNVDFENKFWWVKKSDFNFCGHGFKIILASPESDFSPTINSTKIVLWISVFTIVFFIIIINGLFKKNNRYIKSLFEKNIEIQKQKEIVEEKSKEITDSIEYAKRIQSAILPPEKLVKEYLQESFILYKPKDIVAGDFYWFEQKDNMIMYAAADCTGHGVPGAMVSVVCNNSLNRSVREFGLAIPGEILTKTRELVIEEFEKSEEVVKDGMDIALCTIDGTTLKYAGANNPLWLIRNGELLETKASKQPIGCYDNLEPYPTHTIELQKGDVIYTFSDGYADQFGGKKGKKFKAKAFRELLLSIQDKSMEEQKIIIDNAFENWKGDHDQVDDVCVIGVRI